MNNGYVIYQQNLVGALINLAHRQWQEDVWANKNNPNNYVDSFDEAVESTLGDGGLNQALEAGEIAYDLHVTKALIELDLLIDNLDDSNMPDEELIKTPTMQLIREKSLEILHLIAKSDGKDSTIEIVDGVRAYFDDESRAFYKLCLTELGVPTHIFA